MKSLIIILALASVLFAQDSVTVTPVAKRYVVVQGININPASRMVDAVTPVELYPYISADTMQKNLPPFRINRLTWKYSDFGADSVVFIKAAALVTAKVKARITLK